MALFGSRARDICDRLLCSGCRESSAFVKDAEQYFASGNLKAAEIELKNAVRQSPKDPAIHWRLAEVYLRLGDAATAGREARGARELNADEVDYLTILVDALLLQKKFKDLFRLIEPGDPNPVLESKGQDGARHPGGRSALRRKG